MILHINPHATSPFAPMRRSSPRPAAPPPASPNPIPLEDTLDIVSSGFPGLDSESVWNEVHDLNNKYRSPLTPPESKPGIREDIDHLSQFGTMLEMAENDIRLDYYSETNSYGFPKVSVYRLNTKSLGKSSMIRDILVGLPIPRNTPSDPYDFLSDMELGPRPNRADMNFFDNVVHGHITPQFYLRYGNPVSDFTTRMFNFNHTQSLDILRKAPFRNEVLDMVESFEVSLAKERMKVAYASFPEVQISDVLDRENEKFAAILAGHNISSNTKMNGYMNSMNEMLGPD